MSQTRVGFAVCGSFCTFHKVFPEMENLVKAGYDVLPIMSQTAYSTDTRFGKAADFVRQIEDMTGHEIIHTIFAAEPIGPKKLLDILVIAPATGNTLAKLANGVTDTPAAFATGVPPDIYAFHRYTGNSAYLCTTQDTQF